MPNKAATNADLVRLKTSISDGARLLRTKLYKPSLPPKAIDRNRLLRQLSTFDQTKVILVSAPAGFGKTTLIASWLAGLQEATGENRSAWLTLDKDDNEQGKFWKYVVAALQTVDPDIGHKLSAWPPGPMFLPAESWLPELLHDLETTNGPVYLVLDDYHVINSAAIHQSLYFLIQHLPPHIRLILIARAVPPLPVGRLRVQGDLAELRAADLAFDPDEVEQYLNSVWQLQLSVEEVAQLVHHTEGWPAGIKLAAKSLYGCDAAIRHDFIQSYSGSNQLILAYLLEEVLLQQPPSVRDFLLQTSLLPRLSVPLCAVATGQPQEEVDRILDHLASDRLFIIPLDDEGHWYRYHPLFAEALNRILERENLAMWRDIQCRTVEWCLSTGHTEWAINHALSAKDYVRAAELIEAVGDTTWSSGDLSSPLRWIESLPKSVIKSRLPLSLLYIWMLFLNDKWKEAMGLWEETGHQFAAADNAPATQDKGRWLAIGGAMSAFQNEPGKSIQLSKSALTQLSPKDNLWQALTHFTLGLVYQTQGHPKQAADTYRHIIELCGEQGIPYLTFITSIHLIEVCIQQGRLYEAQALCTRLRESGLVRGSVVDDGSICLGVLHYERNNLTVAEKMLNQALAHSWPGTPPHVVIAGHVTLAKIYQSRHDWGAARLQLDAALNMSLRLRLWAEEKSMRAHLAHLALIEGRWDDVRCWQAVADISADDIPEFSHEVEHRVLAEILIAEGQFNQAEALLARLRAAAERSGRNGSEIVLTLWYAVVLARLHRYSEAESAVRHILPMAQAQGYIRSFLDSGPHLKELISRPGIRQHAPAYVDGLCRAFDTDNKTTDGFPTFRTVSSSTANGDLPAVIDQLTPREWEILTMISRGASNQEIADQLVLSVGTVKGHVNHIFSKLNVHNRTAAVARARDNQLIRM